jgi:acetoin utilization deacetylase AcuC-like enzyme
MEIFEMSKIPEVLVHSPKYNTDLASFGVEKPFALDRGSLVISKLSEELGMTIPYLVPNAITQEDALLVHSKKYWDTLQYPKTWQEIFELKENEYFPHQAQKPLNELIHDICFKSGGTALACRLALQYGFAANLGGGYHHAFPNQGRGFCVLHDIAIAICKLQKEKLVKNVIVIDVDFHQGDGTAVVFKNKPEVFTLSIHSEEGWPEEKQISTLDVPILSHQTHLYQQKLEEALNQALSQFQPDLAVFVAGSDPYELDVLPGTSFIKLSLEEMRRRDEYVLDTCAKKQIPLAMVFAGGYGPHVWEVHYYAVRHMLSKLGVEFT